MRSPGIDRRMREGGIQAPRPRQQVSLCNSGISSIEHPGRALSSWHSAMAHYKPLGTFRWTGGCVYAVTEELEGSVLGSHSGRQSQSAPSAAWRVASYFVSFRIEFFFACSICRMHAVNLLRDVHVYSRRRLQPARSGLVVSAREIVAGAHPRCFNVGRLFLPG